VALELVPELRAPRAARVFAAETLADWNLPAERVEAVQLVVSELVTNALRHAPESPKITVQLRAADGSVHIRVSDRGGGTPERRSQPDPGSDIEGGRGVWIVDAFTDEWGTEQDAQGGKTVWCTVRAEPASER
jgi:anti-sigma regulatory factor (Ser/Thr protein kinase)